MVGGTKNRRDYTIVTIDHNVETVIHYGLLREAEAKALRTLERLPDGSDRNPSSSVPKPRSRT